MSKPILTISLLASNRPDTIRRCLDSLRAIMEKVPSELILVDTSKNLSIHEILLEYTDQVYDFEWCKDFAKARNVGIDKANGEWFLFIDDDEWFVDIKEIVDFFQTGEYKKYAYANHKIRNFYDRRFETYSDTWVSRLFSLKNGARFHSKIHEYVSPLDGECKLLDSISYHTGYIYDTEEEVIAHGQRNISLLLEMIEEEPDTVRWQIQLAQEYFATKDWDRLYDVACKYWEKSHQYDDMKHIANANTLSVAKAEALLQMGDIKEAEEACIKGLADKKNAQISYAFLRLIYAEILYKNGKYKEAKENLALYYKAQEVYGNDASYLEEVSTFLICHEAFDDKRMNRAATLAMLIDIRLGDTTSIEKYYESLKWGSKYIYIYGDIVEKLVGVFATTTYREIYSKIVSDLFRNQYGRAQTFIHVLKNDSDKDRFDKLMNVLAKAKGYDWYLSYAKLIQGKKEGNFDSLDENLKALYLDIPNIFLVPDEILEIMRDNGISQSSYWRVIPFDKWLYHCDDFLEKANRNQVDEIVKQMNESGLTDLRFEYFISRAEGNKNHLREFYYKIFTREVVDYYPELLPVMVTKDIGLAIRTDKEIEAWKIEVDQYRDRMSQEMEHALLSMEGLSLPEMMKRIWSGALTTLEYTGIIYREEVFEEHQDILPNDARAALHLMEIFHKEPNDVSGILKELREAGVCYLELGENIKRIAERMSSYKGVDSSMIQALIPIKEQIISLSQSGLNNEALDTIMQLRNMFPFDKELLTWEQQLME